MDLEKSPRLLVISINAWSDKISSGNTLSNHLANWDKNKLFNIYLREEEIDNNCCEIYFRISEKDMLKSIFSRVDLGDYVFKEDKIAKSKMQKASNLRKFIVRLRPNSVLLLREVFWKIGFQRKNKLKEFLLQTSPEVIYILCPTLIYGHRILHYCQKQTNAKVVVFHGDENYSYKSYMPLSLIYQFFLRRWIKQTTKIASINFGATTELCDYYSRMFDLNFNVLYKSISLLPTKDKTFNKTIKIVYAGNLLYGRWKTLSLISKAIGEVTNDNFQFEMSIYTNTPLSKEMHQSLNNNFSKVYDAVPYEEVKKIMNNADIVLHVEAFDKKNIQTTKYSFSTKITDCIESDSCILAVGPKEVASMKFLENSGGAIISNNYPEIIDSLRLIIDDVKIINEFRFKMNEFAKTIFDKNITKKVLHKSIISLPKDI
jgi:hypothetical protein